MECESGGFTRVAAEGDLTEGERRVIAIDGQEVLLCRSGGQVYAVSNICSHADERLDCGRIRGGWIACPVHGARFDLTTGRPMNPPATRPLPVFETRLADGWIEVASAPTAVGG